jgi:predicted O-methyltransferase YrrM
MPRAAWRPEIEGWAEDILPYYRARAAELRPEARIVEIGVAHGRSALFLAEQLEELGRTDVELWAVDFWPGRLFRDMVLPQLAREDLGRLVDRVRIVRADGVQAAGLFEDNSVDLCFIDSDHTAEGMRKHLAAWSPKIRSGGIIAGHDYSREDWPGVVEAVDAFTPGGSAKVGRPTRTVWEYRYPDHGAIG